MWAQTNRSRTYSERYGARSPWLAGACAGQCVPGLARPFRGALRPVLFLALLIAAGWFAYRGLEAAPDGALSFPPSVRDQFDAAFHDAARSEDAGPVLPRWNTELAQSLRPGPAGGPDLLRAQSFAASLPAMMGEETLALHLMRHERRPDMMQVDLVAMPAWRRKQIVAGVLDARSEDAQRQGIDPVWLIESSSDVQQRYASRTAPVWRQPAGGGALVRSPRVTGPEPCSVRGSRLSTGNRPGHSARCARGGCARMRACAVVWPNCAGLRPGAARTCLSRPGAHGFGLVCI